MEDKKVIVNFKLFLKERKEFMKVAKFDLNSSAYYILRLFVIEFIEKWRDEEKRVELFKKYNNKK